MSADVAAAATETPWRRFSRQFAESRLALIGLAMLAVIVTLAVRDKTGAPVWVR